MKNDAGNFSCNLWVFFWFFSFISQGGDDFILLTSRLTDELTPLSLLRRIPCKVRAIRAKITY